MITKLLANAAELKLADLANTLTSMQEDYYHAQVDISTGGQPILRQKYQQTAPVSVLVDSTSVSYECHEYEGAQGKGWILHAWVTESGIQYHWQKDFGPEGRTATWKEIS